MGAWIRTLWDAALFKTEAYERLRDRRDAFMQGFFVIVVVALLVGLPGFVTQLARSFRPPEAEIADARSGFQAFMDGITPFLGQMGLPAEAQGPILEQAKANFESVATMIAEIEALPTALPRPIGKTLTAFGAWVSHPFGAAGFPLSAAVLATWLGYGIWVMLAAKLMGGRGTLTGFFGTTALFAVPHVLDFFRWVPYVGRVPGLRGLHLGPGGLRQGDRGEPPIPPGARLPGAGAAGDRRRPVEHPADLRAWARWP